MPLPLQRCGASVKSAVGASRYQEVSMSIFRDKYKIGDVDFFNIRNRNEGRVVAALRDIVEKKGNPLISDKDMQDIYSLALNVLPPRYTLLLHVPQK